MNDVPANAPTGHRVLLLGGTGRTGGRVLVQLLDRGVRVAAIVRSADRVPHEARDHPQLQVVTADLLTMPASRFAAHLKQCDTVISCLGHNLNLKGVYGAPRDLVERAVRRVHAAAQSIRPAAPIRLILMSSVSVNQPDHADTRRGTSERAVVWLLRGLLPPARDNQRAADFLAREVGPTDPYLQWVVVRADTLRDGDLGEYVLSGELATTLLRPDSTQMSQIGHFMCELVTNDQDWGEWAGKMPVITDASTAEPSAAAGSTVD